MSNIKKICAFLLVTLIMTGCANEILEETPQESAFSISKETQNLYLSEIQKKLDEFYWRYDQDSLIFEPGFMPSKDLDNYDTLISCFESANVNYANKESLPAVIADITLLYYNGDIGGTGRFYFVEEELCGAYYSAPYDERTVFGLKERNIFLSSVQFEQYESGTEYDKHTKSTPSIPISGFGAEGGDGKGNKLFASIDTEHQIINIYTFVRSFTLTKTLKTQEPEYPVSAAFSVTPPARTY